MSSLNDCYSQHNIVWYLHELAVVVGWLSPKASNTIPFSLVSDGCSVPLYFCGVSVSNIPYLTNNFTNRCSPNLKIATIAAISFSFSVFSQHTKAESLSSLSTQSKIFPKITNGEQCYSMKISLVHWLLSRHSKMMYILHMLATDKSSNGWWTTAVTFVLHS